MGYIPIIDGNEETGFQLVSEDDLTEDEISLASAHASAIGAYLSASDDDTRDQAAKKVGGFAGKTNHGVPLLTDLDRIAELDEGDRLPEQFYLDGP